jgi:hypothetical protein
MPYYTPELQKALARVVEVKAAHEGELFKLPGVHAIGAEPKTTRGTRTTEFAIVVYVVRKKPASELQRSEIIPPVIEGVSTDVVEATPLPVSAGPATIADNFPYPHVLGGAQIVSDGTARATRGASLEGGQETARGGTLGCVAINQVTTDPSKIIAVALTNAHVLLEVAVTTVQHGQAVGQPDTSSKCCKTCDHTIGHIDHDVLLTGFDPDNIPQQKPTGIDAGFVTLDPGVPWAAEVIKDGAGKSITTEPVAGSQPVHPKEALFDVSSGTSKPIYEIHMRGATTGKSITGFLTDTNFARIVPYKSADGSVTKKLWFINQLKLEPKVPNTIIAQEGDSGMAVLNSSSQVIGLQYSAVQVADPPSTFAMACPIGEVETQLHVKVADSVTYPGLWIDGKPAAASHASANLPAGRAALRQTLETTRAELASTDLGRQLDRALHRHLGEIRGLANAHKRTAAVWRRIGGPAWIGEVLKCLLDRGRKFPAQLEGRSLDDCIGRLAAVLQRCGSECLVNDMRCFEPELRALAGRSYDEVFAAWRTQAAT